MPIPWNFRNGSRRKIDEIFIQMFVFCSALSKNIASRQKGDGLKTLYAEQRKTKLCSSLPHRKQSTIFLYEILAQVWQSGFPTI
jgi:hypothetical protein